MLRKGLSGGVAAGFMVGIGGAIFLACDNRYIGAALFTIALLTICSMGMNLFTGKVGYLVNSHKNEDYVTVLSALAGNIVGTALCALLVYLGRAEAAVTARALCEAKLAKPLLTALPSGMLCGILMYVAVQIYRTKNTYIGILFCIPVFILSGFEHSIADMFYFWLSGIYTLRTLAFIALVVIGNALGGWFLPALDKLAGGEKA